MWHGEGRLPFNLIPGQTRLLLPDGRSYGVKSFDAQFAVIFDIDRPALPVKTIDVTRDKFTIVIERSG